MVSGLGLGLAVMDYGLRTTSSLGEPHPEITTITAAPTGRIHWTGLLLLLLLLFLVLSSFSRLFIIVFLKLSFFLICIRNHCQK